LPIVGRLTFVVALCGKLLARPQTVTGFGQQPATSD